MRKQPVFRRLDVPFGGEPFPSSATIAFSYNDGQCAGPAPEIIVLAGKQGTWTIAFTPHEPLLEGAQVAFRKLENEFRFAYRHQHYWPDASNYVTVENGRGQALPFECDTCLKSAVWAVVTLPEGMEAGERIVVRLGDQRWGGAGSTTWPTTYQRARVAAGVRTTGKGPFRPGSDATVSVTVVPLPPVKQYYLFAPSQARVGEDFAVVALPVDINGNPIEPGQAIDVRVDNGDVGSLRGMDLHSLHATATARSPGIARVKLTDTENEVSAHSNPIHVRTEDGYNVYWGEFHWHGYDAEELNVLNPDTHPDKAYRYGRDASRLDFCGSGSHVFRHVPDAVHEWWELYREAAKKVDEPGRYVPLLGCEWRDTERQGGDRNIVWRDLDAPVPDPTWKIGQMYQRFRGQPVMIVPHVGGTIAMPYQHDPQVETLCEMVSGHGNFEWFAQAYLSKGYKVGLIGGSDGHRGTPGHPRVPGLAGGRFANLLRLRDMGWSGGPLLGVLAERLDRDALWEAFRARRTYASTGARALLEFRVNGATMGAETQATRNVEIAWRVEGTTPIERVDLIRDQFGIMRWECGATGETAMLIDRPPDGTHYYYLRVEQRDGEMLWSSPVWVDSTCGGSDAGLPAWNAPEQIDLERIGDSPARAHLDDLMAYLRTEERAEAFTDITPYKVVASPLGSYAVFLCHLGKRRLRIHWFYEFESPRIRIEVGWCTYGRERIMGQSWSQPLLEGQDRLGG